MKSWNLSVKKALSMGYSVVVKPEKRFGYTSGMWDHNNNTFTMWDVPPNHRKVIGDIIEAHKKHTGGDSDV
jgi:hypothetical protein